MTDASTDTQPPRPEDPHPEPAMKPETVSTPASGDMSAQAAQQSRPKGGFTGGLLGGLVAAAIGFGAAQLVPQGWPLGDTAALQAQLQAQAAELAALKAELAALPQPNGPLMARLAALETAMAETGASENVPPDLAPLEARLTALETAPKSAADPALAAELAALKAQVATLGATGPIPPDVAAMIDQTRSQLAGVEAKTAQMLADAQAAASATTTRAALSQLTAALDSGAPFASLLPDLAQVPEALAAQAETGIPTLPALRDSFPAAARAALEASLQADMGATWAQRIGSFLQAQTGARSLTPREGSDPDAILSRAEAALAAADLTATLRELATLPDAGKAALADWTTRAQARLDAQQALATLIQQIGG